ncbi:BatD family protein, partial [Oleiphilus sp. HI0061]|uniref:BatD family protein n=1 Tax=Oleiphilus sp. HI0061 TaxID=1822239 RepID=UPI002101091B
MLDRQQNYSMRSINGDTTTEVTWNYTLSPKQAGTLTIPQAILQGAKSEAIVIEVVEGKAPIDADNPPPVFIEVETDKSDVYVQEQIQYTVRLFSLGRLSSGNLSEPATSNAIIEPFGEENKYYRMAYNQRYEVIERKYLIYPQKSGALYIDGLAFNGVLIDSYQ